MFYVKPLVRRMWPPPLLPPICIDVTLYVRKNVKNSKVITQLLGLKFCTIYTLLLFFSSFTIMVVIIASTFFFLSQKHRWLIQSCTTVHGKAWVSTHSYLIPKFMIFLPFFWWWYNMKNIGLNFHLTFSLHKENVCNSPLARTLRNVSSFSCNLRFLWDRCTIDRFDILCTALVSWNFISAQRFYSWMV